MAIAAGTKTIDTVPDLGLPTKKSNSSKDTDNFYFQRECLHRVECVLVFPSDVQVQEGVSEEGLPAEAAHPKV